MRGTAGGTSEVGACLRNVFLEMHVKNELQAMASGHGLERAELLAEGLIIAADQQNKLI